jgi:hypothetical protein
MPMPMIRRQKISHPINDIDPFVPLEAIAEPRAAATVMMSSRPYAFLRPVSHQKRSYTVYQKVSPNQSPAMPKPS